MRRVPGTRRRWAWSLFILCLAAGADASANGGLIELHQVLEAEEAPGVATKIAALTLDACDGGYDADLVAFLIEHRIPATVFVTGSWLERNPGAIRQLLAHADLFDIENHGASHVPAFVGKSRRVYGIAGATDLAEVKLDVVRGAAAIERATGASPRRYRGATSSYDGRVLDAIRQMGYEVTGFSVNADFGARLSRERIVGRLSAVRPGDIILAHVNRPRSATAEGLSAGLKMLQERGFRFVKLGDPRPGAIAAAPAFGLATSGVGAGVVAGRGASLPPTPTQSIGFVSNR